MYNFYNYQIPDERQSWRSASEIELAALNHEKRRMQILYEDTSWVTSQLQNGGNQKKGLLSFLRTPLQMLATLFG
ncbi:MAG: hypothetical protein NT121_18320 [Chloroflexi bacterium]|nr:hypothetical protein [Chloroflexota bacterium]